jgi:signal transduction histidine kinase
VIQMEVEDDGVGGAAVGGGSGLIGLKDRVEALGGTIDVRSPSGKGTAIQVRIPTWTG